MSRPDDEPVAELGPKPQNRRAVWERPSLRRLAASDAENMLNPPPDSGNNNHS
jgi:hypothetical protein